MRGTFDYKTDAYPFLPTFIGNDIVITNQVTGEEFLREPVAGEYQSEERKAQAKRFDLEAVKLKRAQIQARDDARKAERATAAA